MSFIISSDVYMYYKFNGVDLFIWGLIGIFLYIILFSSLSQREGLSRNQKRARAIMKAKMDAKLNKARAQQAQVQKNAQAKQTEIRKEARAKIAEDNKYFDGLKDKVNGCFGRMERNTKEKISEKTYLGSACIKQHADTVREIGNLKADLTEKLNKLNSVSESIDNELTYIDSIVETDA